MHASQFLFLTFSVLTLCNTDTGLNLTSFSPHTFSDLFAALSELGYGRIEYTGTTILTFPDPRTNHSASLCTATCNILGAILTNVTSQPGSAPYFEQQADYWSNQQAETLPACRVRPQSARDVSASLLVTKFFRCPFAVKSGGHACFAGASNIQSGLTIDLANLNVIQVSDDRTLTQVGAGNLWGNVYSQLDRLQLSVIGGRVAGIGVGGLTLGGGISFFSGRHGWACDGVRNYQVVLADASIVDVNDQSFPDLYFALRGGGNNFGIVTRFDLETFPQAGMWGGMRSSPLTANVSLLTALYNFAIDAPSDPDAALIVAFAFYKGTYFTSTDLEYAKPIVNPPIFNELVSIESISSTLRITNLTDLVEELNASQPHGLRELYTTATFKNDPGLMTEVVEIFISEVEGIKDTEGILPALVFQPITTGIISYFGKNGGNALGITESDGPLILMNIAVAWANIGDDDRINTAANRIIDRSIALAKSLKLHHRFIYQNYASQRQDVFAGYGAANKQRLIDISRKYDPEQVFQKLQPGYFKLGE
ncbi:hypothetical protein N7G274_009035 [Stereocaulon virgatum]|uniref:FAD-binding PCMH-type domain-containing protein n=1 Tax=Stereocaulon virgatum TaxID=373712 RepID=A0ABR3ZZ93_9LECA